MIKYWRGGVSAVLLSPTVPRLPWCSWRWGRKGCCWDAPPPRTPRTPPPTDHWMTTFQRNILSGSKNYSMSIHSEIVNHLIWDLNMYYDGPIPLSLIYSEPYPRVVHILVKLNLRKNFRKFESLKVSNWDVLKYWSQEFWNKIFFVFLNSLDYGTIE